jgi:hypothetical protein
MSLRRFILIILVMLRARMNVILAIINARELPAEYAQITPIAPCGVITNLAILAATRVATVLAIQLAAKARRPARAIAVIRLINSEAITAVTGMEIETITRRTRQMAAAARRPMRMQARTRRFMTAAR